MGRRLLFLCVLVSAASAPGIVTRHDREDAKYVALGSSFKAYGDVVEAGSTLIAPQWVLTAGHVAVELSPYTSYVSIGGKEYTIDRVILHPEFVKSGARGGRDLALLRLTEAVKGIEPVALYRGSDEAGMTVTFFGRGQTGNGETGPKTQDMKLRGAQNKLERANETSVFFQFDAPETAVDLEGISGPGDSGGPALVQVRGKWHIVGVSSANKGNGKGLCRYGTTEIYARVSTALDWLDSTMKSAPPSTVQWAITPFEGSWPKTQAGEVAGALLSAFSSGDAATMEAFNQKYRTPQQLASRTPEQRAEGYKKFFDELGPLEIREYAVDSAGKMVALVYSKKAKGLRQLSLYFDGPDGSFGGYWLGTARQ
jgi:hypothetical protein